MRGCGAHPIVETCIFSQKINDGELLSEVLLNDFPISRCIARLAIVGSRYSGYKYTYDFIESVISERFIKFYLSWKNTVTLSTGQYVLFIIIINIFIEYRVQA